MEHGPEMKMYFLLKLVIFHCHVSLPEGTSKTYRFQYGWAESLPGLPEAVKPWDEIKAVMFGEVGTPGSVESGWCFFVIKAPRFWVGHVWKTHWGDKKKAAKPDRF